MLVGPFSLAPPYGLLLGMEIEPMEYSMPTKVRQL